MIRIALTLLVLLATLTFTTQVDAEHLTTHATALIAQVDIMDLIAQADAQDATRTSLAEAFFIQRHPVTKKIELLGSLIVWFLLALSMACLGLLGAMALDNRRDGIIPDGLAQNLRTLIDGGKHRQAAEAARDSESDLGDVMQTALMESAHGHAAMLRAAEQVAEERLLRRMRRIEPLNVIGNVAPMIGLFGTVYGMILAFREIVAAGGTPDPVGLAAGIGTALTTTFWGLVVAIPALAGYALLRNAIDGHALQAERAAEELINRFRPAPDAKATKERAGAA